jgi:hypothetical protein
LLIAANSQLYDFCLGICIIIISEIQYPLNFKYLKISCKEALDKNGTRMLPHRRLAAYKDQQH